MPSKDLPCEFCQVAFRKDALPTHMRSKHTKEIGLMLLRQYKDENYSTLRSFAMGHHPKALNIWSELYPDSCYFFGVKPQMFFDEDSWGAYIRAEENMKKHQEFIEECLDTISLRQFLVIEKEMCIRAPEVTAIKAENRRLEKEMAEAEAAKRQAEYQAEYWKHVTEEYKDTLDAKETFNEVRQDRDRMKSNIKDMEATVRTWRERIDNMESEMCERIDDVRRNYHKELREMEAHMERTRTESKEIKEKMEKVQNRIKSEAGKMMDKELEKRRKEKAKRLAEKMAKKDDSSDSD